MNKQAYWFGALICACMVICGIILAAIRHELIIVRTSIEKISDEVRHVQAERKKITCFFIKGDAIKTEPVDIVYMADWIKTTQHICNAWLQVVYEEQIVSKPVTITHVATGDTHEVYLSFDRNPFEKNAPVINKIHFMRSLLYTLAQANVPFTRVFGMVNGNLLQDPHLDFSHGWPLCMPLVV